MGWVSDNITFNRRIKRVLLPRDRTPAHELAQVIVQRDLPEVAERLIRDIVLEHHPELAGCTIEAMRFDYTMLRWEALICHGTFDPVSSSAEIPTERLGRVCHTSEYDTDLNETM